MACCSSLLLVTCCTVLGSLPVLEHLQGRRLWVALPCVKLQAGCSSSHIYLQDEVGGEGRACGWQLLYKLGQGRSSLSGRPCCTLPCP